MARHVINVNVDLVIAISPRNEFASADYYMSRVLKHLGTGAGIPPAMARQDVRRVRPVRRDDLDRWFDRVIGFASHRFAYEGIVRSHSRGHRSTGFDEALRPVHWPPARHVSDRRRAGGRIARPQRCR